MSWSPPLAELLHLFSQPEYVSVYEIILTILFIQAFDSQFITLMCKLLPYEVTLIRLPGNNTEFSVITGTVCATQRGDSLSSVS